MAEFEVTAPDGRRFRVTAPEGATQEQIFAYVQQQMGAQQAAPRAAPVSFGESVAMGAMDPIQGGAQMLTRALPEGVVGAVNRATQFVNELPVIGPVTRALGMVPATSQQIQQQTTQREQDYQRRRAAAGETGFDVGRVVGGLATGIPVALATRAPQSLPGAIAQGATLGAGMAATTPVADPQADFWGEKMQQAGQGAVIGGAAGGALYGIGRAIAPQVSPEVRTLSNEGVELTSGQIVGGAARSAEDMARSVPLAGQGVIDAQRNAITTFNRAIANRALAPLGQNVPNDVAAGRSMVNFVEQQIQGAYNNAVGMVRQPIRGDQQFASDVRRALGRFMTPEKRTEFEGWLRQNVISRLPGGLTGHDYQAIKSELGRFVRETRGASSVAEREMGRAAAEVLNSFRRLLARTNPQANQAFNRADVAYSQYLRMADAARAGGAVEGIFTPSQFAGAVRRGDPSLRRGAYARGEALMQDISDAGQRVLPSTVPDSGTAGRAMGMGAAGFALMGQVPTAALAGGAALYGAYTPFVQRMMRGLMLSPRSAPVQAFGDAVAQAGGAIPAPFISEWNAAQQDYNPTRR